MTALVSVYTGEGFVFGADGRRSAADRVMARDDVQKIYGCRAINVRALFGCAGYATFGDFRGDFSLWVNALAIIEGCESKGFEDMKDYGDGIATSLCVRMRSHLNASSSKLDPSLKDLATLAFVGYVNGEPQSVQIRLSADRGFINEPRVLCSHNPPLPSLNVTSLCRTARESYDSLVARDEIRPCATLTDGSVLIQKYVQMCADEQTGGLNPIGGHIHIAAITPSDLEWMVPPKP